MKKFLTLVVMMLMAVSYSMDITRNEVAGLLGFGYVLDTTTDAAGDDVSYNIMGVLVPNVRYEFEGKPSDMFKIYFYADVNFDMFKSTVDGKVATGQDTFGNMFTIKLGPAVKVYLPNNLFVKVELPFYFENVTPQLEEDAGDWAMSEMALDMHSSFGFDNTKIRIHGLTPWDGFVKGMSFYGTFNMAIMETKDEVVVDTTTVPTTFSVESVDTEELHMYFGVKGNYAFYNDKDMMVKPYLSYRMGLNDKVDDSGYLNIGVDFAKDFNEQLNLEAGLDFGMEMLADEDIAGNSSYNTLMVGTGINYYVIPELAIGVGYGMEMDLTTEDANPVHTIIAGAEYTLNFIK